jgi:hypothetical protein
MMLCRALTNYFNLRLLKAANKKRALTMNALYNETLKINQLETEILPFKVPCVPSFKV